jgi:putative DNA primase/helicase
MYNDMLKTPDYRDRMDIEKYAMLRESTRRRESFIKAASWTGTPGFSILRTGTLM